jgi:hypothetical protein
MRHSESEVKKDIEVVLMSLKSVLTETAEKLKGCDCRIFMAKIVSALGKGGQRGAERIFGWNRKTIRKGTHEIGHGAIRDNFADRGRRKAEELLPNLLKDIREIVEPNSQADPTFRTMRLYTPVTAVSVRKFLISEKGYSDAELPTVRTISNKLNMLGYYPQKVAKAKPKKNSRDRCYFRTSS